MTLEHFADYWQNLNPLKPSATLRPLAQVQWERSPVNRFLTDTHLLTRSHPSTHSSINDSKLDAESVSIRNEESRKKKQRMGLERES